jgi:carboxyl-terminal processing protease
VRTVAASVSALLLGCLLVATSQAQDTSNSFDWVWRTVRENFYDPTFNEVDWEAAKTKYQARVERARSREERAAIINEMLAGLRTSHTRFYTPDTPEYFQLLGLFLPLNDWLAKKTASVLTDGKALYPGIGIFTEVVNGQPFVRGVFEGLPAHKAGILLGDRIVSVDGAPFHPVRSLEGKTQRTVSVVVERSAGVNRTLRVTPQLLDGATMFVDAMESSVEVANLDGKKVGYIHAWSYAGKTYQEVLEEQLLFGKLKDADALVLDVRDGLGGASPSNLNIFTQRCLSWTAKPRAGEPISFHSCWPKPVVLLVDHNSRSGKELLAYAFKRGRIGPVVGTRTAGAVMAGRIFANETDASLLYLATQDIVMDDGKRLEGSGVEPDIEVPLNIPFAQGRDAQKDRAMREAALLIRPTQ